MSSTSSQKLYGCLFVGACAILIVATVAQAQYNTFDSDSNSDSEGNPILTKAELGKLVRNSAKMQAHQNQHHHQNQQLGASTRNLYNRQQPMQYAPAQQYNRRHYGSNDNLNGYGPVVGAASNGRGSNANNDDDDEGSKFGPNFNMNFDSNEGDGEGSGANSDGPAYNLNQAASGYPGQGDYNNDGLGFNFGGSNGYGPSGDGDLPSELYGYDGKRAKSASSSLSSKNFGSDDDGALQYGPNSAVNSRDEGEDEGRSGYAPEGNDNENDDD